MSQTWTNLLEILLGSDSILWNMLLDMTLCECPSFSYASTCHSLFKSFLHCLIKNVYFWDFFSSHIFHDLTVWKLIKQYGSTLMQGPQIRICHYLANIFISKVLGQMVLVFIVYKQQTN